MALVTFPAVTPNDVTLGAINNTAQFVSPLSGHVQTLSRGGGRWRLRLGFRNLLGTDRGKLQGFIGALNGSANTFRVQDHSYVRGIPNAGTRSELDQPARWKWGFFRFCDRCRRGS